MGCFCTCYHNMTISFLMLLNPWPVMRSRTLLDLGPAYTSGQCCTSGQSCRLLQVLTSLAQRKLAPQNVPCHQDTEGASGQVQGVDGLTSERAQLQDSWLLEVEFFFLDTHLDKSTRGKKDKKLRVFQFRKVSESYKIQGCPYNSHMQDKIQY